MHLNISWPQWPSRFINIWTNWMWKNSSSEHFISKINSLIIPSKKIDENIINHFKTKECLIIDDFDNDIRKIYFILQSIWPIKITNI